MAAENQADSEQDQTTNPESDSESTSPVSEEQVGPTFWKTHGNKIKNAVIVPAVGIVLYAGARAGWNVISPSQSASIDNKAVHGAVDPKVTPDTPKDELVARINAQLDLKKPASYEGTLGANGAEGIVYRGHQVKIHDLHDASEYRHLWGDSKRKTSQGLRPVEDFTNIINNIYSDIVSASLQRGLSVDGLQKIIVTDVAAKYSPVFKKKKGTGKGKEEYERDNDNHLVTIATGTVTVGGYDFIDYQTMVNRREQIVVEAVRRIEAAQVRNNNHEPVHTGRRWYVDDQGMIHRPK